MAFYEYLCEVVDEEFEAEHSIKIVLEECSLCKAAGRISHAPKRLISLGGKGIVEQTVAELKASLPGNVEKIRQRARTDEKFLANLVGENKYNKNPR